MAHQRYLNLNVGINSTGYLGPAWRHRKGGARLDFVDPEYYIRLSQIAYRGVFDAVFFSDHPALMTERTGRPFHSLDPLIVLTAIAARVPDIGLVLTASSTYNSPYNFARRTQTLDVISNGRLIINIVSSFNPAVAANFGNAPLPPRKERYARATEFIDVLKKLWDSWDLAREGSIGPDQLWDNRSAHPIDHNGEFFSIKGPLNVPRSRQGQPVIAQAGASEGGLDLAARHGEIIYCNILSKEAGFAFGKKVRDRAIAIGRDPREILIVPGVVPIVADSYEAALRRHELVSGAGSEDGLLKRFATENGIDPQGFDPDAVLDPERFLPDQNRILAVGMGMGLYDLLSSERLTARQAVRRTEGFHRLVLGTPEQVADALIDYWQDGAVDGYTVQPPIVPDDLQTFVDQVIPVLQDRGVYPRDYDGRTIRERYGLRLPQSALEPA